MIRRLAVGALADRIGRAVGVVAVVWTLAWALWGLAAPPSAGHFAVNAAAVIAGENVLRWKTFYPITHYVEGGPKPSDFYIHHPFGWAWSGGLGVALFGRHVAGARAVAAACTTLTAVAVYRIGSLSWGRLAGGVAALVFGLLPVTLGYASFLNLEVPVIAGWTVATWGYLAYARGFQLRHLLLALSGLTYAVHADWEGFLWAGVFLALLALRTSVAPRLFPPTSGLAALQRHWILAASLGALSFAFYLYAIMAPGFLSELMSAYHSRASGAQVLGNLAVMRERSMWVNATFTPLALPLGMVGLALAVVRFVLWRRDAELALLALFVPAYVQYFHLRQGADVHVFWPHVFTPFVALSAGMVVASLEATLRRALTWSTGRSPHVARPSRLAHVPLLVSLTVTLVFTAVLARMAVPFAVYIRATGGCVTEKDGRRLSLEADTLRALQWATRGLPRAGVAAFHRSFPSSWHTYLGVGAPLGGRTITTESGTLPPEGAAVLAADGRSTPTSELKAMVAGARVEVVGPYWFAFPERGAKTLTIRALVERSPGPLEWAFLEGGVEPMRDVTPDPFREWEVRQRVGQPAEAPTIEPTTVEQRRIRHNVRKLAGDEAGAHRDEAELRQALADPRPVFDDGTEVLGVRIVHQSRTRLEVLVRAGSSRLRQVSVRVVPDRVPQAWPAGLDTIVLDASPIPPLPFDEWTPGWLYTLTIPLQPRPGHASYEAELGADPPLRGAAAPSFTLYAD